MPTIVRLSRPPPSTNALYANKKNGRFKTKAYQAWLDEMGWEINIQRPEHISGRVDLDIQVQRLSARSDVSNRAKALEDLLVKMGIIEDDRNVHRVSVAWGDIIGCVVIITAVD